MEKPTMKVQTMTLFELLVAGGAIIVAITLALYFRRLTIDTLRLDALQTYNWQLGCIDGEFGVLAGSPPKMVGSLKPTVREAIDAAILERQHAKGS